MDLASFNESLVKHVSFRCVEGLLNNGNGNLAMQVDYAQTVSSVHLSEVIDFLQGENVDVKVKKIIARKIQCRPVFADVENLLTNPSIDESLKLIIAKKISNAPTFGEIKTFLENNYVHSEIKEIVLNKMSEVSDMDIDSFMSKTSIDVWVKLKVGKILEPDKYGDIDENELPRIILDKISKILGV